MILYDTKYLQLKSTISPSGKDWVYAHRPNVSGVVVILPIVENSKVLFLTEKRPPLIAEGIAEYTISLPAGLVGDERKDETTEEAITAELEEETGLRADKIEIKSRRIASSPGCVSEVITIAKAYISEYKFISAPVNDGGIIIGRVLVDIDKIDPWLEEQERLGASVCAHTLAGLYYLK